VACAQPRSHVKILCQSPRICRCPARIGRCYRRCSLLARRKTQSHPVSAADIGLIFTTKIINMSKLWHERQKNHLSTSVRCAGRVSKGNLRPSVWIAHSSPGTLQANHVPPGTFTVIRSRTIQWPHPGESVLIEDIGHLRPYHAGHQQQRQKNANIVQCERRAIGLGLLLLH